MRSANALEKAEPDSRHKPLASFAAMELLVGHKDGYCMDLNNYRLYHDAETDKFIFIAHGMDFTLDDPILEQDRAWKGVVARAFLEMPEGRRLFKERVGELGSLFYSDKQLLSRRVDEMWKVIGPAITDAAEKESVLVTVRELQSILQARAGSFPRYVAGLEGE